MSTLITAAELLLLAVSWVVTLVFLVRFVVVDRRRRAAARTVVDHSHDLQVRIRDTSGHVLLGPVTAYELLMIAKIAKYSEPPAGEWVDILQVVEWPGVEIRMTPAESS